MGRDRTSAEDLESRIERVVPEVVALRRDLHAHPELSRQEHATSRKVREILTGVPGLEVLPPLMETDVVAVLNGDRDGRCIALRADMDALPITEATGASHASTAPGVMHACGHDGHTAILVGVAKVLGEIADALPGKVKFVFQPDEEQGGGGSVLCERGVLSSPDVDAALALHGWPMQPVGTISVRPGAVMAANNAFAVTIRGQGAHGAYPHRGIDPIVVAAHVITALQTVVSRRTDPLDSAVVTVGHIAGGTATNVISSECQFKGTLRYLRAETGERVREQVARIIEQTATAHGAEAEVRLDSGYPPMVNDVELAKLVHEVGAERIGEERVITTEPPSMGVEDFAFYAERVPAVEFRLGVRPVDRDHYPGLHSPEFDFNDDAIPLGIGMFCEVTRRFLNR